MPDLYDLVPFHQGLPAQVLCEKLALSLLVPSADNLCKVFDTLMAKKA